MQANTLHQALKFYAKTGMRMTRVAKPTAMLELATTFSGKKYKRGEYLKAAEDLSTWIETMRAALPCEDNRKEKA
jgi:hypothetical protein